MAEYINKEELISYINKFRIPEAARLCLLIKNMPSANVRPVKRGKWAINTIGFSPYCVECGTVTKQMTKYCPNCGARMEFEI